MERLVERFGHYSIHVKTYGPPGEFYVRGPVQTICVAHNIDDAREIARAMDAAKDDR